MTEFQFIITKRWHHVVMMMISFSITVRGALGKVVKMKNNKFHQSVAT